MTENWALVPGDVVQAVREHADFYALARGPEGIANEFCPVRHRALGSHTRRPCRLGAFHELHVPARRDGLSGAHIQPGADAFKPGMTALHRAANRGDGREQFRCDLTTNVHQHPRAVEIAHPP